MSFPKIIIEAVKKRLGDFSFTDDELEHSFKILSRFGDKIPSQDMIFFRSLIKEFAYVPTADAKLFADAMKHADHTMHQLWDCQTPEFKSLVPEPDAGCPSQLCKDAWGQWLDKCKGSGKSKLEHSLDEQYAKLDNVFDVYADSTWRKPSASLKGWSRDADLS